MGLTDQMYRMSPLWLQNTMVSAFGLYWHWLRFGGSYHDHLKEYRKRSAYSLDDWQCYQKHALNELLADCAVNVPYYRQTWTQNQVAAAMHGELHQLPLLEKEPLRSYPEIFLNERIKPFPKLHFFTSGTTGTPITSYFTLSEVRNTLALREARSANWAGVTYKSPRATISNRFAEPDPESKGPFYRYNAVEKQVYFSAFHIKPDNISKYIEAIS